MHTRVFGLIVVSSLLASNLAWAQEANTSAAPQMVSRDDPDHVICRSGEKPTGSMLPGPRICHTQKEWESIRAQAQRALELEQNHGLQSGVPN
ncbi:MAG TPA: hypothetical protein VIM02_04655 [Rhizomicrobium sp.]|jgi:hypothetical protein